MQGGETQVNQTAAATEHAAVDVATLVARSMADKLDGLAVDVLVAEDSLVYEDPINVLPRRSPRGPTIYKVIPSIREKDSSAYDPKIVSIGPFHRANEGLRAMQEVKWRYLHDLRDRSYPARANLDRSIAAVGVRVEEIRGQYSEKFGDIADDKFLEMMVLDGCFILELMMKLQQEQGGDNVSASLPGGKWALPLLLNDLMLVENQIPFFVLENLFEAMAPITSHPTVVELAFSSHVVRNPLPPEKEKTHPKFLHLLHMDHYCQLFYLDDEEPPEGASPCSSWRAAYRWPLEMGRIVSYRVSECGFLPLEELSNDVRFGFFIPNVTKLKEAGVRFKKKELQHSGGLHPRKLCFSKDRVFEIPLIVLDAGFNSDLRNLVAYEQCCRDLLPGFGLFFPCYCFLMALLVDTERDVDILVEHRIIFNHALRPRDVAALFDNACSGVSFDPTYMWEAYGELIGGVMKYLQNDIHRWRAKLVHDYFGNPWSIASVVAAFVLLVLTVFQTFYAMYPYYHPR